MTPEEKELLHRSVALGEQNNDILRSIQRHIRLSRFFTVLYWIVIIGSAIGAFYFVKPYIQQAGDLYGGVRTNFGNIMSNFNGSGK